MDKLQHLFGEYIFHGTYGQELLKAIKPTKNLTKTKSLQIYREDYQARLTSVLQENFKALWTVLGDQLFFKLCEEYIALISSTSNDLGDFGNQLPDFLKDHSLNTDYPFLMELAELELNFTRLFHLPLEKSLSPEIIGKTPHLEEKKFSFIQAFYLKKSSYPLYHIWNLKNLAPEEIPKNQVSWGLEQSFCLFKNSAGLRFFDLTPGQFNILNNLAQSQKVKDSLVDCPIKEVEELFSFISSSGILKKFVS